MNLPTRESKAFGAAAVLCAALAGCSTSANTVRRYAAPEAVTSAGSPRVAIVPPGFTIQIDGVGDISEAERMLLRAQVETQALGLVVQALRDRGYTPSMADVANAQDAVKCCVEEMIAHGEALPDEVEVIEAPVASVTV